MEWLVAAVGKRIALWWLETRPFSEEKRQARQDRRDLNDKLKESGLSRKERKMKLREILAKYRTSTKAGVAGFVPLVAMLPFYDTVNDYLLRACQSEDGPTVFLASGLVVWLTMYVAARRSKTPVSPGVL